MPEGNEYGSGPRLLLRAALSPSLSTQPRAGAPLAETRAGARRCSTSRTGRNKVVVYKQRGPNRYVRSISTAGIPPNAVAVAPSNDLWVALDTYPPNNIAVYHRGESKPYRTLSDPWAPVSIAVAPDGTAYVTSQGNEKISVFAPGSSSPTLTLNDKNGEYSGWVALDANGNLYYTYWTPTGQGAVDEFPSFSGSEHRDEHRHLTADGSGRHSGRGGRRYRDRHAGRPRLDPADDPDVPSGLDDAGLDDYRYQLLRQLRGTGARRGRQIGVRREHDHECELRVARRLRRSEAVRLSRRHTARQVQCRARTSRRMVLLYPAAERS